MRGTSPKVVPSMRMWQHLRSSSHGTWSDGPDVDRVLRHLVVEHRGDGVGLADLLGLQAVTLEHVQEVGVATEVELVGAVERTPRSIEEARHHAVGDGGADLALDVVTDDGQALVGEPRCQ